MSRQLKFRAWDKDDKKMIDWLDLVLRKDRGFDFIMEGHKVNDIITKFDHDMILMQYTGQKDKNGVEIYEGDIVLCEIYSKEYVGLVEYTNTYGFYYLSGMGRSDTELWGCNEKKVIGNIYENPELMV